MQVHHAIGKHREYGLVHHAHVAGHDDVVDVAGVERASDDLVGGHGVGIDLLGKREGLQARRLGARKAVGRGTAGHDELDGCVKRTCGDTVDKRLEVGTGPGEEHADAQRLIVAGGTSSGDGGLELVARLRGHRPLGLFVESLIA